MPNASISYPGQEPTPCRSCRNYQGVGEHLGRCYVKCAEYHTAHAFYGNPETGCRYYEREPGSDDEPLAIGRSKPR